MARTAAALLLGVGITACDLDLINPNSPTDEAVLSSRDGVIGLAVGLQNEYSSSIRNYVLPAALATDEWGPRSRALAADKALFAGTPDAGLLIVQEPFQRTYEIIRTADDILGAVPQLGFGDALGGGLTALARLHKAMALGNAIQIYEAVPVATSVEGSPTASREVVLDTVLALLEAARSDLSGVNDADLAGFRSRVLDPGLDLRSSIDAMLARYYLIDGQYDNALAAADRADDEEASYYTYAGTAQNPIYQYSIALDYVWPLLSFAREAEPGDDRVPFWTDSTEVDVSVTPPLSSPAHYLTLSSPYALYRPDEMRLIRAEVYARQGDLPQAIAEINAVREQCAEGVEDPAPCLPPLTLIDLPTEEAVLAQIAYERRYELFLTGLRWEDLRRLDAYTAAEPKVDFLPLPERECTSNPNLGC